MLAAIDLNQFIQAGSARSWLLNLRWPELARDPQSSIDLQAPDGLA
jgi:hypothetical protein